VGIVPTSWVKLLFGMCEILLELDVFPAEPAPTRNSPQWE